MAKAKIPGGITPENFMAIRNLLNKVLQDIETVAGAEPKWVSCRLNESRDDISPVFVGWVEHKDLVEKRVKRNDPDPGLFRFGDDHYSQIYEECLQDPGVVKNRDWTKDLQHPQKGLWMSDAKKLSVTIGVMYRRSIGIKVDHRCVGTLNVGLIKDPVRDIDNKVEKAMKKWADPNFDFVKYLRDNFELGGPIS